MAAEVNYLAETYETSQVVSFNGLKTLFENQEIKYPPVFYTTRDPKPVKFQLKIMFGADDEEFLSVFVRNMSKRKVYVKRFTCKIVHFRKGTLSKISSAVGGRMFNKKGCMQDSWGWDKFYKANELKDIEDKTTVDWQIQITCKMIYESEFCETVQKTESKEPNVIGQLSDDLRKLLIKEKDSDVTFTIGDEKIKAHRLILSARSEYFDAMFHSRMKEDADKDVEIHDCEPEIFMRIIEFLYTDTPPEDIDEISMKLLPYADQYLVTSLKNHCANSLKNNLSPENIKEVLILAHTHNCPSLKERCFEEMTFSMFSDWDELKNYGDLTLEYLQFLSNRKDN